MGKASNQRDAASRWQVFDMNTAGFHKVAWSGSYNDLENKPTLFSGSYADLTGKPTIPAAQVQTDWNATSGMAVLLNKPAIPSVPKVSYFSVTTDANGLWSVNITGFTSVSHVSAVAINTANTAAGARIATLSSFTNTLATGTVCLANSITSILGLLGLGLSGAGVSVRVRVEGT